MTNQIIPMNSYCTSDDNDCVICMDGMKNKYTTKCNHEFCLDCIDKWTNEKNCCPLCRCKNIFQYCECCDSKTDD